MSTKAIPEGYHTITPMLVLKDSRKAIAFYKKAFGGTERCVTPGPEGKGIMHAEMTIGNSKIMMSDECPNRHTKSAETMGTSPVSFYLYVNDLDTAFQRAVDAGATAQMELQEMFWGDRVGMVRDPFGYCWMLATHVADVSPEEMKRGAEAMYAGAGKA